MKVLNPKKILIMKFRNIGDVLLVTPLIKNLKLQFPNSLIDVAVNHGTQDMVTLNKNINDVLIYDRDTIKKLSFFNRAIAELKFAYMLRNKRYDMLINTTKGDRGAQLALFSGAKIKIGYGGTKNILTKNVFTHILPSQKFRHTIETNLDVLSLFGLKIQEKKVEIFWNKKDEIDIPYKFVHIHPVSRWLFKCINDKTMAEIIDYIEDIHHLKVILTAAPVEEELNKIDSILSLCHSKPINMSGKLTLKQTASLNKKASFFIGVDTAIMHISAANDVPVLAFFGPSGADHWGPWDNDKMESGYTIRRGFQSMGKHRVIQENWECVPCGQDGCEGTKISNCLMQLNMTFIKHNIDKIIQNLLETSHAK
jgi:heptosyltransferase-3